VEVHLRSLLVELGATLPTRGLYFVTPEFARKEEIVAEWAADNAAGIEMIRSFRRKQGRVR
jgi:FMN reductase